MNNFTFPNYVYVILNDPIIILGIMSTFATSLHIALMLHLTTAYSGLTPRLSFYDQREQNKIMTDEREISHPEAAIFMSCLQLYDKTEAIDSILIQ